MRTLGIDLASADDRTGPVTIEWTGAEGHIVDIAQPASDDLIEQLASTSSTIATDAPLGWPIAFTDAIIATEQGIRGQAPRRTS